MGLLNGKVIGKFSFALSVSGKIIQVDLEKPFCSIKITLTIVQLIPQKLRIPLVLYACTIFVWCEVILD